MKGHPVFIAQHATATCCRKCIQKWHRIEKGRALNTAEADYVVALIMAWIEQQIN
jgi:exodeoxyribonuclease V alpha subunit